MKSKQRSHIRVAGKSRSPAKTQQPPASSAMSSPSVAPASPEHPMLQMQQQRGNHHVLRFLSQTDAVQRAPGDDADDSSTGSGELAWEIFKPIGVGAIRSLAPGALKLTEFGGHHKNVIDIVSKLEGTVNKLDSYSKKISSLKKDAAAEKKFALKSLGKINSHISSIPDAVDFDGEELINEAAGVVNGTMFTDMSDAIGKLESFDTIVRKTKDLRSPYGKMIVKLQEAESRTTASFDALGVLEDALLDIAKYAVLPAYQAWAFSTSQTVAGYRSDVGTILSTLRNKRKGYEKAIASSEAMEAYMSGKTGRKQLEKNYRDPKNAKCLARLKSAIPFIIGDSEAIYEKLLAYAEADFDSIMDSLDFIEFDDSDGFFAVTDALRDAYPNMASAIDQKEKRYEEATWLMAKLDEIRPTLQKLEAQYSPLVVNFIYKEYYHFWRDDTRNPLSNYSFTYIHQITAMQQNAEMLVGSTMAYDYLTQ